MRSSTNKHGESKSKRASRKFFLLAACLLVSAVFLTVIFGMAMRPKPKVYIKKLKNKHFQLIVDKKPYLVKGVCYNPVPIGSNHEYDWWSDPNKPWLVDGKLMKDMGVNTVRLYQAHEDPQEVKQVIRDLYEKFGIRTILGSWLGFWNYPCPLYGDADFQKKISEDFLQMVNTYKDEPGILLWIMGNENNYSCFGRVNPWVSDEVDKEPDPFKRNQLRAKIYYSFLNNIAKKVHAADPNHPVALGNGELLGLDSANLYAPDIDIVACIIYRGKTFGNLFNALRTTYDRPILLAEFGADCYDAYLKKEDQNMQAFFLESQWTQIYKNIANNKDGAGNCIGGAMFEWTDEWWKHNQDSSETWTVQDTESNWSNGSYYFDIKAKDNKNMNEEWFGIVALSPDIESGLNKRKPRKAYYVVREFWKNPSLGEKKKSK